MSEETSAQIKSRGSAEKRALHFTEHPHKPCLVFETGRMIMPLSDGKTETRKMIALGKGPSLEVRSDFRAGFGEDGGEGDGVCEYGEREEGRGCLSFFPGF